MKYKGRLETPSSLSAFCFYWTELGINNFLCFNGKEKIEKEQILHLLHESDNKYKEANSSILDSYDGGVVDHISKISGLNLK